jgi:hypothetical protein
MKVMTTKVLGILEDGEECWRSGFGISLRRYSEALRPPSGVSIRFLQSRDPSILIEEPIDREANISRQIVESTN